MDVLCVLNRQPTWAKITQTVHGKGQRAESKDQRADMCTDGQPQTSYSPLGPKSPEQSTGRASVLICVLMDVLHGRPVCADGQPRTATDVLCVLANTHGRPVQPTWAKITRTVHGKGQSAESNDQRADICTDGQTQTSCSTGRARVLSPSTKVMICVLMDSHGRPVCADGHTRTHMDSHGRPPTWAKITRTVHVRASVLSPRTNVLICVLMDSHIRPVCADGHTQTHTDILCVLTDTDGRPVCADGQPLITTNVLCVLADTHRHTWTHTDSHGRPVCADGQPRMSCVCWRTPTDVLCVLNRHPTWAKITQRVHRKGHRAESKNHCADM
ncbi:unnamed protein product [Brassica rapa]|uniref:Uncharacterized protein n=1 Tax=Brassica campestris TaxID=3711 RepID=A0A8D9D4F6_BRACM|nr:unnamed protein product [Brassica rapa]